MKEFKISFEWTIKDTRIGGYRKGISTYTVKAKNKIDAINQVIEIAKHLPSWEFEQNEINLEDYREFPKCTYYYETALSKILYIGTRIAIERRIKQ